VALKFKTTYSNSAADRYYINFAAERGPENFLYDTWVYIASPSSDIANLEMDMNEVMANGDTVYMDHRYRVPVVEKIVGDSPSAHLTTPEVGRIPAAVQPAGGKRRAAVWGNDFA
jgi:hypothetical protein